MMIMLRLKPKPKFLKRQSVYSKREQQCQKRKDDLNPTNKFVSNQWTEDNTNCTNCIKVSSIDENILDQNKF